MSLGKKRVLIVDDEPKNLVLLKDILECSGYATLTAGNGKEAILVAEERMPDLILMDVHLPIMDGLAATEILKSNPDTASIPILALSGYSAPEDELAASKAGCDAYIIKPFNLYQLRKKLEEFLAD